MNLVYSLFFCVTAGALAAQTQGVSAVPSIKTVMIDEGIVVTLHLRPGYATSVKCPDAIHSVLIGNPATFKAEHSELEPRLVFFKPITRQPSESNALITTKSGQEISLQLVSAGTSSANPQVDFLVEYRREPNALIDPVGGSFLIPEAPPASTLPVRTFRDTEKPDYVAEGLKKQRALSSPKWEGKAVLVALGDSVEHGQQTIVSFSVLNNSNRPIELLPPQIELRGARKTKKGETIKAEPVPASGYQVTARRLEPRRRVDGIVVFERPRFKESGERLQLRLAMADQVDRPIVLPLSFTADGEGH